MADIKFTNDEVSVLRSVLSNIVIRKRTGEIGIIHGADRFVSTHLSLRKTERDLLNQVAIKLGLNKGLTENQS